MNNKIKSIGSILNFIFHIKINFISQINLVGETVNLMAIDSGRLEMLAQNVNTIWSAPLQTGLSLYFLWTYLGISALAGLIVMILLIPVNAILSRQMRKYQIDNMKNKDTRIKVRRILNDYYHRRQTSCCPCSTCYTTFSAPPRNYLHNCGTLFCPAPNLFTTCYTSF